MHNTRAALPVLAGGGAGARVYFRPALFWQKVMPDHVCDSGLDFRLGLEDGGVNRARFAAGDFELEAGEPARLQAAITAQTRVVPAGGERDDRGNVAAKLAAAATWGDAELAAEVIRTCYVTEAMALPCLAEAAAAGSEAVVALLLAAGAGPAAPIPGRPGLKTALHVACEAGCEATARLLVGALASAAELDTRDGSGHTALEALRRADMGGIARRLEALAKDTLGGGRQPHA